MRTHLQVILLISLATVWLSESSTRAEEVTRSVKESILSSWDDVLVSDERLKTNVTPADTEALLDAVSRVQLREFDYIYEQFYNPIFGKRQLGIIAQEIKPVLPGSVGVIPKRSVSHVDDENPTILTDVHVFHSENLFMAHIGATQELIARTKTVRKSLDNLKETLLNLEKDAATGKQAHEALNLLQVKQSELETLAKEAHQRSEGAIRLEHVLKSLEDTSRIEQAERTALSRRLETLQDDLRTEVKDQAGLHREISTGMGGLNQAMTQLGSRVDQVAADRQNAQSKLEEAIAKASSSAAETAKSLESMREDLATKLEKAVNDVHVRRDLMDNQQSSAITSIENKVGNLEQQLSSLQKEVEGILKIQGELTSSLETDLKGLRQALVKAVQESSQNISSVSANAHAESVKIQTEVDQLLKQVAELEEKVNAQAAEEIIERRKSLEAQARIEEAKIELERTKTIEEEKRARSSATIEAERREREDNASIARVREEESMRAERELQTIRAKEESATRELELRAEKDQALVRAQAEADVAKIHAQGDLERVRVLAQGEADAQRERQNHDLRKEMAEIDAKEAREKAIATIQAAFQESIAAFRLAAQSPREVAGALSLLVMLAFGIYAGREFMVYWRTVFEHRLGQPSLVRETSQRGWAPISRGLELAKSGLLIVNKKLVQVQSELKRRAQTDNAADKPSKVPAGGQATAEDSFVSFMSDVVLPSSQAAQIERIARATRAAHVNNTPLRHLLFYGPPGTGKTMVARRLSKWCGLDYAIMSGADVAPLKDRAVTELHQLFEWANRTPRGVALFIDEADAFLATRDSGSISESLRNSLTALLYHTGAPSCRIMLILATNRPRDLDSAVLDRVDESVHFDLPSIDERHRLVQQYFSQTLSSALSIPKNFEQEKALKETAKKTDGFSGREIAKLMTSVQAHVYGSATHGDVAKGQRMALSRSIFDQVLEHTVLEHKNKTGPSSPLNRFR